MCAVSQQEANAILRKAFEVDPEDFWDKHGFVLTDGKTPPVVHMGKNDRTNPVEGNPNGRPHQIFPQESQLFGGEVAARRS